MIVCDECRDVMERAFECNIILTKKEMIGTKHTNSRRQRTREIVSIPIALCEKCITNVCKSIGHMKQQGKLSGQTILPTKQQE